MDAQPLSTTKTIAVFAIVVGCFAVLYPRFFHPVVIRMLGYSTSSQVDSEKDFVPPHIRPRGKPIATGPHQSSPHPGMRQTADVRTPQTGPGRGMMGIILPMYAVGIVVYLIYTLIKVFGKKDDPKSHTTEGYKSFRKKYSYEDGQFQYDDDISDSPAYRHYMREKYHKSDYKKTAEEREMVELQRRLIETEAQMSQILQAMKKVSTRVDRVMEDAADIETKTGNITSQDNLENVMADSQIRGINEDVHQQNSSDTYIPPMEHATSEFSDQIEDLTPGSPAKEHQALLAESITADAPNSVGSDSPPETESENESEIQLSKAKKAANLQEIDTHSDTSDNNDDLLEKLELCQEKMEELASKISYGDNLRHRKKPAS